MDHVAFIINPFSAKKNYHQFLKNLQDLHPEAVYYVSDSIAGTENFVKDHFKTTDIFIAVGGDGTISSVAKQLINTGKILGIYPAGSGNGFSKENDFDKDLPQLLSKIKVKKHREIDTFTVNEHLSINVSGAGFDGAVVREFEKTSRGFRNYIKTSFLTFFRFKSVDINFKSPELKSFNGEYLMMNIANTRQFGNNAYIAPHASAVDGLAEIVLVKKFPFFYGPVFAFQLFAKTLKENKYVKFLSLPEVEFSTSSCDWHIDGDYAVIDQDVQIKVLPRSLKILI